MCRLFGMRSESARSAEEYLTGLGNSLARQSRGDRQKINHPDGWGIARYDDGRPRIAKGLLPASEDPFFHEQAAQAVGETVLAHVRKASVGTVSIENTHPFAVEHWLFAHNGTITAPVLAEVEQRIDKELIGWRQGQTDSEAIFLWLLSRITSFGLDPYQPAPDVQTLVELVGDSFSRLVGWSNELAPSDAPGLNLMLTDGRSMVCSRWNRTLAMTEDDGLAFIASEPVDEGDWTEVPEGSVAWIDAECRTGLAKFL